MGSVCEGRRMGQPIFSPYHHIWLNTLSLPEKFKHWLNLHNQLNYCRTQVQHHLLLFMVITTKGKFSKLVCLKCYIPPVYTQEQFFLFDDTCSNRLTLDTR